MNQNIINDFKIIEEFDKNELLRKGNLKVIYSMLTDMLEFTKKYKYDDIEIKEVNNEISLIHSAFIKPLINLKNEKDKENYLNALSKENIKYSKFIESPHLRTFINFYLSIKKKSSNEFSKNADAQFQKLKMELTIPMSNND